MSSGGNLPTVSTSGIYSAYLTLSNSAPGVGRFVDHARLNVFLSLDPSSRPVLTLRTELALPPTESSRGIDVSAGTLESGINRLSITCSDPDQAESFSAILGYLLASSNTASSELEALDVFLTKFDELRDLLGNMGRRLTTEELRGLFAELWFLTRELLAPLGVEAALRSWNGPFGADQDFTTNDAISVEIKSTHQPSTQVRIASEAQLDTVQGRLFLYALPIEPVVTNALGSLTITDLIEEIVAECASHPGVATLLEEALLANLTTITNHQLADFRVEVGEPLLYEVSGDFPRITRADIPSGVSEVGYKIDLHTVTDYRFPLASLGTLLNRTP